MTFITSHEATKRVQAGKEAFAVYGPAGRKLFDNLPQAESYLEVHKINGHVLDWETGEYAD